MSSTSTAFADDRAVSDSLHCDSRKFGHGCFFVLAAPSLNCNTDANPSAACSPEVLVLLRGRVRSRRQLRLPEDRTAICFNLNLEVFMPSHVPVKSPVTPWPLRVLDVSSTFCTLPGCCTVWRNWKNRKWQMANMCGTTYNNSCSGQFVSFGAPKHLHKATTST